MSLSKSLRQPKPSQPPKPSQLYYYRHAGIFVHLLEDRKPDLRNGFVYLFVVVFVVGLDRLYVQHDYA